MYIKEGCRTIDQSYYQLLTLVNKRNSKLHKKMKTQNQNTSHQEIDPNDPFGIGLIPYHPDLITFEYTGTENLLLDFEEPEEILISKNKYVPKCTFYNEPDDSGD